MGSNKKSSMQHEEGRWHKHDDLKTKMRDNFHVRVFSNSLLKLAMFTVYIVGSGVRNILTARDVNSENEPQPTVGERIFRSTLDLTGGSG